MSVELVTGYSGVGSDGEPNRHVSSAEDGARQAGTVGLGCYVLSTGSKLSATMEDANTLVVADGDAVMNGRHVRLTETTSFTIPTGVQGQKVSNLAVLRYQVGSDSVESVTPLVLTGEPSTGTPTDPEHNEGSILDGDSPVDFPLYRVVTDGINAGDPEPLFDVLMPMADIWDSVSQQPRVIVGSKVVNVVAGKNDQWVYVAPFLSHAELTEIIDTSFDPNVHGVSCWNADWNSSQVILVPWCRLGSASSVGIALTVPTGQTDREGDTLNVRVGYMITVP